MRDYSYAIPILFLLPAIGILFFLQFVGWGWNINIVLHDVTVMNILREWQFVGLENFRETILDPQTLMSLKNTAIYTGACVSLQLVIGTVIAYFLYRAVPRVEKFFRPIFILPWLTSVLIAAFGWELLFSTDVGLINLMLTTIGIPKVDFFGGSVTAMVSIIVANTWWGTPFTILFIGSGMTSISPQLVEVSKIDGASEWMFFTRVAIPMLLPFIVMDIVLTTVWTFNGYALILEMTSGGPLNATRVLPLHAYLAAFESGDFSYGAAITIFSVAITLILVYFYFRVADIEMV